MALSEAATPGPWTLHEGPEYDGADGEVPIDGAWWVDHDGWIDLDDAGNYFTKSDAEFVAAARTLVPELLAALDRVTAERDCWIEAARCMDAEIERLRVTP
ncbi:MAG: hypothetical protein M3Y26_06760 [Actinomycetota bacterium]|nr:hypothetical protein [Actinomycetota bacterium]